MKETPENTVSKRIFGEWYVDLSDELQESVHRIIALVEEESRIQAFNEGIAPVRAQAKAEKAPPYLVYTIVSHDSVESLAATVQAMIESGWRPQGGVAALRLLSGVSSDYTFCQAMIRGGKE